MPISIDQPIKALSEQEFHDLDYQVVKLAFQAHTPLKQLHWINLNNQTVEFSTLMN